MSKSHPLLLEINARSWLRELTAEYRRSVTLASVPVVLFDEWRSAGFTHIWLMGVWTTGPLSRAVALRSPDLRKEYDRACPGWTEADVLGSPYAVASYEVAETLGGNEELLEFRDRLHRNGMQLILDFVPNHVGLDHPWMTLHPERFIHCSANDSLAFRVLNGNESHWIAHGRDPCFPPWTDTAQLDYRCTEVHEAVIEDLMGIADWCEGVRCDMAMLLISDVFEQTWQNYSPCKDGMTHANAEFWETCIARVKSRHPQFLFLAEAYWNREEELQHLGFDFTYDKIVTDSLLQQDSVGLTKHLARQTFDFIDRSIHFLENHDEGRAASVLSPAEHRVAASAVLALPGMRLLHHGQRLGAKIRTPVQLGVCAGEPVDAGIRDLYSQLMAALHKAGVGSGEGSLLSVHEAWSGNLTFRDMLLIQWMDAPKAPVLVVLNLAPHRSQCRVPLPWAAGSTAVWQLSDLLSEEVWLRGSSELCSPGLYLDVAPHAVQIYVCQLGRRD